MGLHAPDLSNQFPSIAQQKCELIPLETKMSETLPDLGNPAIKLDDEGLRGYLALNGLSYHVGGGENMLILMVSLRHIMKLILVEPFR